MHQDSFVEIHKILQWCQVADVDSIWKSVLDGESRVGFLHPRNGPIAQERFSSSEWALKGLDLHRSLEHCCSKGAGKMDACDTC